MEAHEVKALMAQLTASGQKPTPQEQEQAQDKFQRSFDEIFGAKK